MTSAVPNDLDTVVAEAVAGDQAATDQVLRTIQPLVVRYCRARFWERADRMSSADDVAQEVLLTVLRVLPRYRDHGGPFLAFVYGIAANKVAQARRSAWRDRCDPVADLPERIDDEHDPEQRALRSALSDELRTLLDVLPSNQRTILLLRVVVGLSTHETADVLGSTPGAVRVAQHRALTRLRHASPTQLALLVG